MCHILVLFCCYTSHKQSFFFILELPCLSVCLSVLSVCLVYMFIFLTSINTSYTFFYIFPLAKTHRVISQIVIFWIIKDHQLINSLIEHTKQYVEQKACTQIEFIPQLTYTNHLQLQRLDSYVHVYNISVSWLFSD